MIPTVPAVLSDGYSPSYQYTAVSILKPALNSRHLPNGALRRTDHVTFAEYNNTGVGAAGPRASFATKLSAPISITTVLNSTSWIDSQFL